MNHLDRITSREDMTAVMPALAVSAVFAASAVLAKRWNQRRERMGELLRI
jgi:hypothetical protein